MKKTNNENSDFLKPSGSDLFVISLIILISLFFIFSHNYKKNQAVDKSQLFIYESSEVVEVLDLKEDKTITILNDQVHIQIKDSKVKVLKSDCPHKICINSGLIQYDNEVIACVPNRVLLEIQASKDNFLDAVVF